MTVYTFIKKKEDNHEMTHEEMLEEAARREQEAEEEKKKEAIKAVAQIVSFFTKPLFLMLLWNWLMPSIFGIATIGYLKAFGLYLISRIIFDKND